MATLISKRCANCGRLFLTRDRNKIYCELKCEDYARDGLKVEYKEEEAEENDDTAWEKICPNCGKTFTKNPSESYSGFRNRKTCCGSCGQQYRIKMERANR